jgi:hypothetical protein
MPKRTWPQPRASRWPKVYDLDRQKRAWLLWELYLCLKVLVLPARERANVL